MLDITVKTLDGQNKNFTVPEDLTVRQFKERISNSIGKPADQQRIIFQGKVLQDDKQLKDHDIHGKVVHVVGKAPPSQRPAGSGTATTTAASTSTTRDGASYVVGSFTLPSDVMDPNQVQNIVQQVVSDMGEVGRNASVTSHASDDGTSVDVHINLGTVGPGQVRSEAQQRINTAHRMIRAANLTLDRLENPPRGTETNTSNINAYLEVPNANQATSTPTTTSSNSNGASSRGGNGRNGSTGHPGPMAMAELLQEVLELTQRARPHIERYRDLLEENRNYLGNESGRISAQRHINLMSEVMHYISHAHHNISDVMVDMSQAPPRQLRAPPPPPLHPTAVIQQTIPVQAHISLNPNSTSTTPSTGTQPTATMGQTTSTSSSTTSSSTPTSTPMPGEIPGLGAMHMPGGAGTPGRPPYFMMQMGPTHMTLSSISARVVNSDGSETPIGQATTVTPSFRTSSSTSTTGGLGPGQAGPLPPPPPLINIGGPRAGAPGQPGDFISQILQSLIPPGQRPASTTAATTQPTPTTTPRTPVSSSSNITPQPSGVPPGGMPFPGPRMMFSGPGADLPGGVGLPPGVLPPGFGQGHGAVDPNLPCRSRHFLARRPDGSVNNGENNTLGEIINNIMTGIINQRGETPGAPQSTSGTTGTSATRVTTSSTSTPRVTTSSSTSSQPTPRPSGAAVSDDFMTALRDMLQAGSRRTTGTTTTSTSTTTTSTAGRPGGISDEVFAQMIQGIGSSITQAAFGGNSNETIADFLGGLGDTYNIDHSEGIFNDVFQCISSHLTFPDLMSVFFGNPAPLNNVRGPLQEFIRENLLIGEEENEISLNGAVEQLIEDMQPQLREAAENEATRDDIDFIETVNNYVRQRLRSMIRFILAAEAGDSSFADSLYSRCRNVIMESVVLCRHCLQGDLAAIERLMHGRIRHISSEVNPMIQQWMVNMSSQQLHSMIPNITVTTDDITQYVIHRSREEQMEENKTSEAESMEDSPESFHSMDTGDSVAEAMATEVQSCASNNMEMEVDSTSGPSVVNGNGKRNGSVPMETKADKPVTNGSWEQQVPADWVPIIKQDGTRQRQQPPQRPFSDAYLNGMPPKRRRVMAQDKERHLKNTSETVCETLKKAVTKAGVEPVTSSDSVSQDAANSEGLLAAFHDQVESSIQERLENDTDYKAEQFPKTEKCFRKKK